MTASSKESVQEASSQKESVAPEAVTNSSQSKENEVEGSHVEDLEIPTEVPTADNSSSRVKKK